MWIFLNDRFVRHEQAVVSVFDHGFLYGDGVYETIRSYGPRIFMRDQHLERLWRSAEAIGLAIPIPQKEWPRLLHEAMTRNEVGTQRCDAYMRITISRGEGDIGLDPILCHVPTIVIMAKVLRPPAMDLYQKGVALIVSQVRRNLPEALSPHIKSLNFLNNILAKQEAVKVEAFDSVMLNSENKLAECTTSNLFFVRSGRLCTPSVECGILSGITRDIVLLLAREQGILVEEGRYVPEMLLQADECFITNTSMEIMPATRVNQTVIGNGMPGSLTVNLQALFTAHRERFLEPLH
ncbi:MAG: aminotransferase class IV [Nitrospiraceae bacterium]